MGIILNFLWYLMMSRDDKYQKHYRNWAFLLEKWLSPVKTVRTQFDIREGGKIDFGWQSEIPIGHIITWIIALFVLGYFFIIALLISRSWGEPFMYSSFLVLSFLLVLLPVLNSVDD